MRRARAWMASLESGVVEWIRVLRDAGINTECSCHHEGYIQCQSLDPTTELDRIRRAFWEAGLHEYSVEILYEQTGPDTAYWHQTMEIRSSAFKQGVALEGG